MERQDIYKVFDVNNIFDYSDIDDVDRINMNSFFDDFLTAKNKARHKPSLYTCHLLPQS